MSKTYFDQPADQVLKAIDSAKNGLSASTAAERLQELGPNSLPEPERTKWWKMLFNQFNSFLIWILLAAAVISYLLHDQTDAYIIVAAVLINVIVGFIQEFKAESSLEALRKVITLEATVLRDGQTVVINIEELVPGDIILLNAGDRVPADARLLDVTQFATNEAALTGESAEVEKSLTPVAADAGVGDQTSMVFFGTTVTQGSATAVVTATGLETEIGKIASLLQRAETEATPLQNKLDRFARNIGFIVLGISALLLLIGLFRGLPFVDIFITSVAVAVSAIPEGLIVAVTIILAIGMQRILKRQALVRNLQAAETLGSTSVICTDKTGTLTEGKMQVVSLVTHNYHFDKLQSDERHDEKGVHELMFAITIGMLNNDAKAIEPQNDMTEVQVVGNLTDRALLLAGMNLGLHQQTLLETEPRLDAIPFDSARKYMATLHNHPKYGHRIYVKGAPERVLKMSSHVRIGGEAEAFTPETRQKFEDQFVEFSERGLRILALAYKNVESESIAEDDIADLVFVGFVGIKDPLRPKIAQTFAKTAAAGVHTVMITGDHAITAKAIAREVGLDVENKRVMEGEELRGLSQDELNAQVEDIAVYARVSPEDKLNIINAWQSRGAVVAMTGDGVNDSPALKAANIGVALGSGTDVAKEAADMVLLDDRFETIVAAVEEGRGIFDNIRKVVLYLLSDSFSEVILISAALLLGLPIPLTAAQVLWINLVGDGFPSVALALDPKDSDTMQRKPRSLKDPVMDNEMKLLVGIISVITGLGTLFIFWYTFNTTGDTTLARTVAFATLATDSLIYLFSIRSLRHPLIHRSLFTNKWLWVATAGTLVIQLAAIYLPVLQPILGTTALSLAHWGEVLLMATVVIVAIETVKYIFLVKKNRTT